MTISGKWRYKWAIVLKPETLNELDAILMKYSKEYTYVATLRNKRTARFASLSELIQYENSDSQRITDLTINAYFPLMCVRIKSSKEVFTNYGHTVELEYAVNDSESVTALIAKVKIVFDKSKARYSWFSKYFNLMNVNVIFMIVALIMSILVETQTVTVTLSTSMWIMMFLIAVIFNAINYLFAKGIQAIMPPIIFCWGRQAERNNRLAQLRHNILWGVIVTAVVSVITTLLLR